MARHPQAVKQNRDKPMTPIPISARRLRIRQSIGEFFRAQPLHFTFRKLAHTDEFDDLLQKLSKAQRGELLKMIDESLQRKAVRNG